jgi:gas vesicle protein
MENPNMQVAEPVADNSYIDRLKEVYPELKDISEMTTEEIAAEREKLNSQSDELMKQSQARTYKIQVGTHQLAGDLMGLLNEHCDWTVSDAAVYVSMMNDLKAAKKNLDKEGNIQIRTANITSLYQYLLKMKGKGYTSATNFLKVLSTVGGSVSEAVKQIHDDNQLLKDVHTRLSELDDEKDRRAVEGESK